MMEIATAPETRGERDVLATKAGMDVLATKAGMDVQATRADKVRPHHVQQGSIALRTPRLEQ
jgi:hypothetical protein